MDCKIDIIVLTWNNIRVSKDFVESFLTNTAIACRLIIIDNGSTDGTPEYLLTLKDTASCFFKIVLNKENKGFVLGMNQGIDLTEAPYVCLANNDLLFSPGWLEEIISVFEKNPAIGLLNPNSNSLGARRKDNESIASFSLNLKDKYQGVFVQMPFCIGFCMFIRREVITKIGGLSKEFSPFFFEDTDYSLKTQKAGYQIGMAKGAYVWHQEHATFDKIKDKSEEIFIRNKDIFRKKWGKILRILLIADNSKEISVTMKDAIELVRKGNYIWFMTKDMSRSRDDFFNELGCIDHSGVNFIVTGSSLNRIWKILIKRKRYDVIISKNKLITWVLSRFGFKVLSSFDMALISDFKTLVSGF